MPLLDHFHAPLYPLYHWESFHSHWASILTNQLNAGILPAEYIAAPHVKMGTEVEIDVGTLEIFAGNSGPAGTVTAVYAPPEPTLSMPIAFPALDLFEILIRPEGSARLAAAVEFISPANKDRPASRKAFAIKCASYLQEGASLVVVDIVTNRSGNLVQEMMQLLLETKTEGGQLPEKLYAFACRVSRSANQETLLDGWPAALALGQTLPLLPLWLASDVVVGLPLEDSYVEACKTLRIRAG